MTLPHLLNISQVRLCCPTATIYHVTLGKSLSFSAPWVSHHLIELQRLNETMGLKILVAIIQTITRPHLSYRNNLLMILLISIFNPLQSVLPCWSWNDLSEGQILGHHSSV